MSIMSQLKNDKKKPMYILQNIKNKKYGVFNKVRYDTAGDLDYYLT